jgi:uncharacterized protein YukJ
MPVQPYGVLIGRAVDKRREGAPDDTPHFQLLLDDGGGVPFRVAVNVKSKQHPSELLYLLDDDFTHPVTSALRDRHPGWHPLDRGAGDPNLDFIRGNLFDRTAMRPLPPDVEGPANDLSDLLELHVLRAIADPDARVFAVGERWGPEQGADKVFGFRPGNGVHNIHMNQGNSPQFRADDGVWQDGALLMWFPGADRWVAIFLAFQSQSWHTDDATGHAIEGPATSDGAVRVVAALVNPAGPAPERETVTLLNVSPEEVDVTGWRLADRAGHACPTPGGVVPPGSTLTVPLAAPVTLSNRGGTVSLLDAGGLKVHGVSYTAEQAGKEGWTVVFDR